MSMQGEASANIITLKYPVLTQDGTEVLPAGAEITDETISRIADQGKAADHALDSLHDYGSLMKDLELFIKVPPYNKFFINEEHLLELKGILSDTQLPVPVLETLHYFKHSDFYTYQHIMVVMGLSIAIARDMSLDSEQIREIAIAGATHNIGKVCTPVKVLKKKTALTADERDMINHHSIAGFVLLCYYLGETDSLATRTALHHHERSDGSGGPCGIHLADPMVEIVSIADIYDALISPRAYRPVSFDNRSAIEILTNMAEEGKVKWEPVKAVVARNRSPYRPYNETVISNDKRGTSPPGNIYDKRADD